MPTIGSKRSVMSRGGEISVAKEGGDFTTIEAALAVAGPRTLISVAPGIYVENNPLVIPEAQITIHGDGGPTNVRIQAANANQDLFMPNAAFRLEGCAVALVSGTGWVMQLDTGIPVIFSDCGMLECSHGIKVNHASADLGVLDILVQTIVGPIAQVVCNNAGSVQAHGIRIVLDANVTTIFEADGANAISTIENCTSFSTNVGTGFFADNDARSVLNACSFVGMTDGAVLQGGSDTRFVGTQIFNAQQDSIRIENVGTGTNFTGHSLVLEDAARFDLNLLSATCTASGMGQLSPNKLNFVSGARMVGAVVNLTEDDEGLDIIGELHVGLPELGSESVFGGGDSYTRGMLVYTFDPGGPTYTDVSTAARSASGSTFTFTGTALNHAIYVASSLVNGGDVLQHPGIKLAQTVASVLGGGMIVVEYWNGGAWVGINHMSTLSDSPYTQFAKAIFERTGSDQLRYPKAFLSSWVKNDPMTIDTTYYWIRFRISSAITTAPVFQQFKLHTDRSEVNSDGVLEFFGDGRPELPLITHINLATAVSGSAPGNASVAFTATTTLTLTRNQFNDNQVHSFGQLITIPTGLDTSIPVTVEDVWYPDTANGGDVELRAIPGQLEVGDLFNGTVADGATIADVNTVVAGNQFQSRKSTFEIDVSDLVPGEFLVVRIERDATGGNDPPDTLSGNIVHAEFSAFGKAWRA